MNIALTNHFVKRSKTSCYRRFRVLSNASKGVLVRRALNKYSIKQEANINEEVSALNRYASSDSVSNISLQGYRGLSYVPRTQIKRTSKPFEVLEDSD